MKASQHLSSVSTRYLLEHKQISTFHKLLTTGWSLV